MNREPAHEDQIWNFAGTCVEGQPFLLDGVDVWSQEWRRVPGETVEVKDPRYSVSPLQAA